MTVSRLHFQGLFWLILAAHDIAVVLMVSILSLFSNSFRLFSEPLGRIPSIPTKIGTTVTLMIQSFFFFFFFFVQWQDFLKFSLCGVPERQHPRDYDFFLFLFTLGWFQLEWGELFVFQNLWELSLGSILFRSLTIIFVVFIVYSLRVFHISVSWRFFTGFWVRVSFLKFPGLFSVFWPISIMH